MEDKLTNVQQIQATQRAFAAILGDGSVVTWGEATYGGDSAAVQGQLKKCGRSKPVPMPLLPFLLMDLSWPGVRLRMVVTVLLSSVS